MSHVTDVLVLASSLGEEIPLAEMEEWYLEQEAMRPRDHKASTSRMQLLSRPYERWGGWSACQASVWGGSFNHLDHFSFVEAWLRCNLDDLQILMKFEHSEIWYQVPLHGDWGSWLRAQGYDPD